MALQQAERLMTTQEAAEMLHVSRREVQRLCQIEALPFIRIGRGYRFTEFGLRSWLERQGAELLPNEGLQVVSSSPIRSAVQEQIRWHLAEIERLTKEL